MTKTKPKPKPKNPPPQIVQSTNGSDNTAHTSANSEQQFEVELYWCIQQLQRALDAGKLRARQVQDHTKALNVLMSKTTPVAQKRQVMRLSFGDYRGQMAAEERKVNLQVKLTAAKPSPKSMFVKKSICTAASNFRFNFEVPTRSENEIQVQPEAEEKMEVQMKNCNNFDFVPSENGFKFDFDVSS